MEVTIPNSPDSPGSPPLSPHLKDIADFVLLDWMPQIQEYAETMEDQVDLQEWKDLFDTIDKFHICVITGCLRANHLYRVHLLKVKNKK